MRRLLVLLACLALPAWASAATYYVDCNANGDAGAGTSTAAAVAWKTIAKVNGSAFSAGDSVLFAKGCTWRETLTVPSDGSAGLPITFGAYGSGALPAISGADLKTSWTSESVVATANLFTNPNKFSGTTFPDWDAGVRMTVANNIVSPLAPDGTQTATSVVASTDNNTHEMQQWFATTIGQTYVMSVWVKKPQTTDGQYQAWIRMTAWFLDAGFADISTEYCFFNAMSGTWGTCSANVGNKVISRGWNNWYRISFSVATPALTAYSIHRFFLSNGDTNTSFAGPASGAVHVYLWGAKKELATLPTANATFTSYYATAAVAPKVVLQGGVNLVESKTKADMMPGQYWYDAGNSRVYVRTATDADPTGSTVEAGVRDYGITNDDSAEYITIDGLRVYGTNIACIYSNKNNSWTVTNSTVEASGRYGMLIRGNSAGAGAATGVSVTNNTVGLVTTDPALGENAMGVGLALGGLTAPIISGNTVSTTYGIGAWIGSGDLVGGGAACAGPEAFSNTFTNNDYNLMFAHTTDAKAYQNYIYDSMGVGITMHESPDASVYYNVINNLTMNRLNLVFNGIDVNNNSTGAAVYNNTILSVASHNLTFEAGSTGGFGKNNILDGRTNKPFFVDEPIFIDNTSSATLSNQILLPGPSGYYGNWELTSKNFADWVTVSGEANSLTSDPLFVSSSDFRLQLGSPAINAGVSVGLTQDFWGRPVGNPPEIGAHEYGLGGWGVWYFPPAPTGTTVRYYP